MWAACKKQRPDRSDEIFPDELALDQMVITAMNRPTAPALPLQTRSKNAIPLSKTKKEKHHESVSPKSELQCVVCFDENKNIVFVPCHHLCCCEDCGATLQKCPLCRKGISDRVKIFQ